MDEALSAEWAISIPDLPARAAATALGTSPKAWRFVGEMEEIASTYAAAGLPDSQTLVFTRDEDYGDIFELIETRTP